MPPKKATRTQLCVTDIQESDHTLQAVASTAERTAPTLFPDAKFEGDDDLNFDLRVRCDNDSRIDNKIGDLHSQITYPDHLSDATENRLMLEMILENPTQWKPEQRLESERLVAEPEHNDSKWDPWAAICG